MPRMSSLDHVPSRSGWPHDVRGAFQLGSFTLAAWVSAPTTRRANGALDRPNPGPCAFTNATDAPTTTAQTTNCRITLSLVGPPEGGPHHSPTRPTRPTRP